MNSSSDDIPDTAGGPEEIIDSIAALRMFDLTDRVAIVTGASSGLGNRFARVLHASGATVVVAARRMDRLAELVDGLGERIHPVQSDLTDGEARKRLMGVTAEMGRLDILVNNAGYSGVQPAESEPLEHYQRTMDINLHAVYHLCQMAGAVMIDQGSGSIVNIASILGFVGSAPIKEASYCAAKGAVVNLTRALGAEWGRKGVRVNAIAPGWFPSEMTQEGMFDDESGLAFIESNTPMGRGGLEHELDGALLYLASDASSYVTGQTIAVDGGWLAR